MCMRAKIYKNRATKLEPAPEPFTCCCRKRPYWKLNSRLYRTTELLSRIKHGIRGTFYRVTFSVADHFYPITKKNALFFRDKIDMGT